MATPPRSTQVALSGDDYGAHIVNLKSRRFRRTVLHIAIGIAVVVGAAFVLPNSSREIVSGASEVENVSAGWWLLALVAEACSYFAYAFAERLLLSGGDTIPGVAPLTGQAVIAQASANCLPAGQALSSIVAFRLLRRLGVEEEVAIWMLAINTLLFMGVLALLTLIGAEIAGNATRSELPDLRIPALAFIAVLAIFATVGWILTRRGLLIRWTHRAVVRVASLRRHPDAANAAEHWVRRLSAIAVPMPTLIGSAAWLAVAWIADLAVLAIGFQAIGATDPWRALLLAYGAGQLAASLPITPGGLGVVEGSLTLALVAYGGSTTTSVGAVLLYRLISYWALFPAAAVSYFSVVRPNYVGEHS